MNDQEYFAFRKQNHNIAYLNNKINRLLDIISDKDEEIKVLRSKIEQYEPKRTYVVCKNYAEYVSMKFSGNYTYLEHNDQLRGLRNPKVVFVGNWIDRPDISEIINTVKLSKCNV